jgi:hypothetical protein
MIVQGPQEEEVAPRPTASTESSIDSEDPPARSRFSINGERIAELYQAALHHPVIGATMAFLRKRKVCAMHGGARRQRLIILGACMHC